MENILKLILVFTGRLDTLQNKRPDVYNLLVEKGFVQDFEVTDKGRHAIDAMLAV